MPIKKSVNIKTNHKRFSQRITWLEFVNILKQDSVLFSKIKDFEIHLYYNGAGSTVDTKFTVERLINGSYKKIKGFWTNRYKVGRHWEEKQHSKVFDLDKLEVWHIEFPASGSEDDRGEIQLKLIKD